VGEAEEAGQPAVESDAAAPVAASAEAAFYTRSAAGDRLWQGEILENLPQVRLALVSVGGEGDVEIETDPHPLVIVLSQDCDLERDFKEGVGSVLANVLFCNVFPVDEFRATVRETENIRSNEWKPLKQNKNERFQFLHQVKPAEDLKGDGLSELAIDFRQYFTVRTEEVYRRIGQGTIKRCRLSTPYVEHLADRFSYYLARVALPQDH